MTKHPFLFCAILAAPLAAQSPPPLEPQLSLEQQASLRCAVAFAIVAADQARGVADASAYPPLAARGKEFFVRTAARLIDETGTSRAQVQELLQREAAAVRQDLMQAKDPRAALGRLMQPCLGLLDLAIPTGTGRTP